MQIAVDRNSEKSQYQISYTQVNVLCTRMEPKLLEIGIDIIEIEGEDIKIFNRDPIICDGRKFI